MNVSDKSFHYHPSYFPLQQKGFMKYGLVLENGLKIVLWFLDLDLVCIETYSGLNVLN
jgi:hypothetical protein